LQRCRLSEGEEGCGEERELCEKHGESIDKFVDLK